MDDSSSEARAGIENDTTVRSRSPSVDSQSYAIPMPEEIEEQLSEESSSFDDSNSVESNEDQILGRALPESGQHAFSQDSQEFEPMLDVSKHIFDSLMQAIDSADFSEAISLQTKTSAVINSKSTELKQLIDETKVRFSQFKERFEKGSLTAKNIRGNLRYSKDKIEKINALVRTSYPIEFNEAREKILERPLDDH
ncbi:hypothetical protein ZYGR_0AD01160 [Zygosaccharomyces rouxii]|uniref:Biogenesis of lysosome-related organelles complex 1 subunit KXD1 n=2 Tax=Zygosaccharomyces rouxii TaxID=4956 RepID=KXD1_ZYGRC|nr:uncharacterized protein ZYRO0G08536g [Zygosaccharomyces rouxii]C5E000.1 RecName: Full=Biogenesis of lysosome-related organelles complex 1 subunit KXD1; Short=BLOC-1 subunit KXD1; AltName: Full=KxDL homolog [Zygosaccharomyces rouxii CBS 732]KAH9202428.1 biogenesis of lysosome-related organelles complex 1 subunit KXD1 [Zygosaccharomyces rouxii]GAV50933.1 hypothetical protein ZYGR_0AD01160 [Zygosaccharomyces rouxii]CAR29434.1 ZYRO0G08536p [Zygosaccharomyces rouxii]